MEDLISRQAALDEIDRVRKELVEQGMDGAEHILVHYGRRIIEELPTFDPVKHGKWKEVWNGSRFVYECTICGQPRSGVSEWNYCPNCGARMEKPDE